MAKRGRPKLPRGQALNETMIVRLTKSEKKKLMLAAKHHNETLSQWIRAELWAAADVLKYEPPTPESR